MQFPKEACGNKVESVEVKALGRTQQDMTILYPPQWVQCDLRYLDMTVLGQFALSVKHFFNNPRCLWSEAFNLLLVVHFNMTFN